MKLTFWGAARTVTGSMHQLTVDGKCYLRIVASTKGWKEAEVLSFDFRVAALT